MGRSYIDWAALGDDTTEADVVANTQDTSAGTSAPATPWYDTLAKTITPVIASTYQQAQLTKLNVARMQQGLQPLTAQQYAANYQVPAAQVQVGMDAGTRQLVTYGLIGLAGLYLMRHMRR
jgi:hypothetical protein